MVEDHQQGPTGLKSPIEIERVPRYSARSVFGADADVGSVIDFLIQEKWFILSVIAVSVMLTAVALSFAVPRYTATAQIIIDARQSQIANFDAVVPGLSTDDQSVLSEVQVLKSRRLASSVIESLSLDQDPEFNSALRPRGWLDELQLWLAGPQTESESPEHKSARLIDSFLGHVRISPVPDSRVISASFTSISAANAALIANTLVDEYLRAQQSAKFEAATQAGSWIDERITELRAQVQSAEEEIEDFRSSANLLETAGVTITAQQMADLNGQLILAQTKSAEVAARLEQLTVLMNSPETGGILTASEVLQSPLIQNLRQQQVEIDRRIAELSSDLGASHPTIVKLRAEASDLDGQIKIEVDKIAQGLRNEAAIAKAREDTLDAQMQKLSARMAETNENEIHLRALEREAEANRQLLQTLLAREKEIGAQDRFELQRADARVISYADPPNKPSFPQKPFTLGIVVVLSTVVALIVVFVRELRKGGFTDSDQLESATGVPALGFLPRVSYREHKGKLLDFAVTNARQPFSQALTTIKWQLNSATQSGNILLLTSATSAEGKSTTAAGLARTIAAGGNRTLLIDGDVRKPVIHRMFDITAEPGLVDVLEGRVSVEEVIGRDNKTTLDILPAGAVSSDPLAILDSPQMDHLLAEMSRRYDYVIVDSAPIVIAPDACALSNKVAATVLVVRWNSTTQDMVNHALKQLDRTGGHIAGTVLTMLDTRKNSKYVYGYYGTYGSSRA